MPNREWGFQVQRIPMIGLGIAADQRLGMIIVQPEYELIPDGAIPFRIADLYREAQKTLIEKAFQIRAAESQMRNVPIPFILFPEAAIPVSSPDCLDFLRQQMEGVREDAIFIGGLEGMGLQEAREVARRLAPGNEVAWPAFIADGSFVNVCVIAVKPAAGIPSWYFQAKLRPSQWEQPRNMAWGTRVLYFSSPGLSFLCQICFDHMASQGEESLNTVLCHSLIAVAQPDSPTLDFVFVPQYNKKPNDMIRNTSQLLNYQHRALNNNMMTVVVINKAASVQEPSEYGRSGFHYKEGRWQIPKSDLGPKGYELYSHEHVTSAVFRKRTHAIHAVTLIPPAYNIRNHGNPRPPLENPHSYLIRNGCDPTMCSCLPGTTSAAGTYVECNCLPCKLFDVLLSSLPMDDEKNRWQAPDHRQQESLAAHYQEIRRNMLSLDSLRAGELLDLLLHEYEDRKGNPDIWMEPRVGALEELAAALCVLREWKQPLDFGTGKEWTALLSDFVALVVLDGEDRKYSWIHLATAYWKAFGDAYFKPETRLRPILIVALRSQGEIESGVDSYRFKITQPRDPARIGAEQLITGANQARFYVCQGSLLEQARLDRSIKDFIEGKMRCIYG